MICFDWCFPEVARILALKGADIICHPSNLVLPYAPKAMLARSIENRVYIVTANRVGVEVRDDHTFRYIGLSQIVSPNMEILLSADGEHEFVGVVDLDVSLARNRHITKFNHVFDDMRFDLYSYLMKHFPA